MSDAKNWEVKIRNYYEEHPNVEAFVSRATQYVESYYSLASTIDQDDPRESLELLIEVTRSASAFQSALSKLDGRKLAVLNIGVPRHRTEAGEINADVWLRERVFGRDISSLDSSLTNFLSMANSIIENLEETPGFSRRGSYKHFPRVVIVTLLCEAFEELISQPATIDNRKFIAVLDAILTDLEIPTKNMPRVLRNYYCPPT